MISNWINATRASRTMCACARINILQVNKPQLTGKRAITVKTKANRRGWLRILAIFAYPDDKLFCAEDALRVRPPVELENSLYSMADVLSHRLG